VNNYWEDNTVTLGWKDFKDDRHGDVTEITNTIIELLPSLEKDSLIVEVGCGQGRNLAKLESLGYTNLIGIEINKENIEQINTDYPDHKFKTLNRDAYLALLDIHAKLIITASSAYLMDKSTISLIQTSCDYYIAVEPTTKTHFTPYDTKYNHYNYKQILDKMVYIRGVDCKWDNYQGHLFCKKECVTCRLN